MMTTMALAVFGACIARQVGDHFNEGNGAPSEEDMDRFVEEADSIATSTVEAWDRYMDAKAGR